MTDWQGNWTPGGLRPHKKINVAESGKRDVLWIVAILALSALGLHAFISHQKAIEAEEQELENSQAEAAAEQQRLQQARAELAQQQIDEKNRELLKAQQQIEPRAYGDGIPTEHRGGFVAPVPSALPHRSPQEEYELATQIMQSTREQYRRESNLANSGVMSNGVRVNQSELNGSMLAMAEQYCLPLGKGSINYRHCRANHKQAMLNQCPQVPTQNLNAEQIAQCFAARNYRIVE